MWGAHPPASRLCRAHSTGSDHLRPELSLKTVYGEQFEDTNSVSPQSKGQVPPLPLVFTVPQIGSPVLSGWPWETWHLAHRRKCRYSRSCFRCDPGVSSSLVLPESAEHAPDKLVTLQTVNLAPSTAASGRGSCTQLRSFKTMLEGSVHQTIRVLQGSLALL